MTIIQFALRHGLIVVLNNGEGVLLIPVLNGYEIFYSLEEMPNMGNISEYLQKQPPEVFYGKS